MIPQQSSIVLRPKQKAEPVESAVTEQQWEEAVIAKLRAEIDRMDAVAAASAAAASRDRFVTIDGLLYVKAWDVSEEAGSPGAETNTQSQNEG